MASICSAPRVLAAAALLVAGPAWAEVLLELPPGEDPAAWRPALQVARQLVADLELGVAVGSGPTVRVVPTQDLWVLDIHTRAGLRETLELSPPTDDGARIELLLVCAEMIEAPVAPDETSARGSDMGHWSAPRLAAGADLLPDSGHTVLFRAEPLVWSYRWLEVAALLSVSSSAALSDDVSLRSTHLGLWTGVALGEPLHLRVGPEVALGMRSVDTSAGQLQRDWTPGLGGTAALSGPLLGALNVEAGLRFVGELPPTVLVWQDQDVAVPTWRLQAFLGVRLPRVRQGHGEVQSEPPATARSIPVIQNPPEHHP